MKINNLKFYLIFLLIIVNAIVFFIYTRNIVFGSDTVVTTVKIPVCGNGIQEYGEECDSNDFAGLACHNYGFNSGSLSCDVDCSILTSGCSNVTPPTGGGGGAGTTITPAQTTGVNFSGRAYPSSEITVLKDGQIVLTSRSGPDANFSINLTNISPGNYMFALYAEDAQGRRSSLYTFPTYVTIGAITTVSGIFLSPTITVDKSEVKRGDNLAIFGQATSNSQVTIAVNSSQEFFLNTNTDTQGAYLYNFDTSVLENGDHSTKSKVALSAAISNYSRAVAFKVGEKNISQQPDLSCGSLRGDINCDDRVNLVDFSIAAYWYKRSNPPAKVDLNNDGQVTLVDFSILAYNWTG